MNKTWKTVLTLAAGIGVAYLIYRQFQKSRNAAAAVLPRGPVPIAPLPQGSRLTGRTQTTSNNRPPNFPEEVVSYGVKQWAEVIRPDGRTDWVTTLSR